MVGFDESWSWQNNIGVSLAKLLDMVKSRLLMIEGMSLHKLVGFLNIRQFLVIFVTWTWISLVLALLH